MAHTPEFEHRDFTEHGASMKATRQVIPPVFVDCDTWPPTTRLSQRRKLGATNISKDRYIYDDMFYCDRQISIKAYGYILTVGLLVSGKPIFRVVVP